MTILAQHWLENRLETKYDYWISTRLGVPDATENLALRDLGTFAERFVFTEDISYLAARLDASGQLSTFIAYETVRMPARCVWVEWKCPAAPRVMRVGVLFEQEEPTGRVFFAFIGAVEGRPAELLGAGFMERLPFEKGEKPRINLSYSEMPEKGHQDIAGFIGDALVGLFLVQQPRVYDDEEVVHSPKLQRAREKARKLPLLEYRRVHVKIGQAAKKAAPSSGSGGSGDGTSKRRYHLVLGHFRMYHRGTPNAKPVWIEPHYRGDPELGMLIRERDVSE